MDPTLIVKYAVEALGLIPQLIEAGMDVVKYVSDTQHSLKAMQLEGRDPNDAEWDAINAVSQKLRDARPAIDDQTSGSNQG